MKRILLVLLLPCSVSAGAQSFQQNDNVIAAGAAFGVFNSDSKDGTTGQTDNGDAASRIYTLSYERGITGWLGLGAAVNYGLYFTSADSAGSVEPDVHSVEFLALANAHFAKGEKADFFASAGLGYSMFEYEFNTAPPNDNFIKGGGFAYDLRLHARFYLGESPVALGVNFGFAGYDYNALEDKNGSTLDLALRGPVFGATLAYRLRQE